MKLTATNSSPQQCHSKTTAETKAQSSDCSTQESDQDDFLTAHVFPIGHPTPEDGCAELGSSKRGLEHTGLVRYSAVRSGWGERTELIEHVGL